MFVISAKEFSKYLQVRTAKSDIRVPVIINLIEKARCDRVDTLS